MQKYFCNKNHVYKIPVVSKKKHLSIFTLICLRFMDIDYPFGIFKLFLQINGNYYLKIVHFFITVLRQTRNRTITREGMRCIVLHRHTRNRTITFEGMRCIVLHRHTRDRTIARRSTLYNYTYGSSCIILVSQIGQYFVRTFVK